MTTLQRPGAVATTALLLLGLTACGGDADADGAGESNGPDATAEEPAQTLVQDALAELPDDPAWVQVTVGDLAGAAEAAGTTISQEDQTWRLIVVDGLPRQLLGDTDPEDLEYAPATVVLPGLLERAYQVGEMVDVPDEIGWSPYDIRTVTSLTGGSTGIEEFMVVTGDFPEDALSGPLTEVSDGVWALGGGEALATGGAEGALVFDPMGRPARLAQIDDRIAVSLDTDPVTEWAGGAESTAMDRAELAGPAAALDEAGALSALLSKPRQFDGMRFILGPEHPSDRPDPDQVEEQISGWLEQLSTQTFTSIALGFSVGDDGHPTATIAYHFPSASAAEEAVPTIETLLAGSTFDESREISDALTVESVQAQDSLVVVTVTQPPATSWTVLQTMIIDGEPPFVRL